MQGAAQKGALNRDPTQTERVRRIAQRLIPHTAVFRDDAVRWQWQVNVLTSNQVNAWCMPGGKIAVYTGLIEQLELTDDELAAVMGHEIAHALREHVRERMGRQQATAVGTAVGSAVLEYFTGVNLGELGHTFAQAMFVLPHSRENEQEADRIGVELAARAGYDPRAAVSLWQKMAASAAGSRRSGCRRIRPTRRASVTCRTMRSACCRCMRRRRSSAGATGGAAAVHDMGLCTCNDGAFYPDKRVKSAAATRVKLQAGLLHTRLGPLTYFLRRDILLMRGDPPPVASRVLHAGIAITPELVCSSIVEVAPACSAR